MWSAENISVSFSEGTAKRAITASTAIASYKMNATRPALSAARNLRNLTQSVDPRTRDKSTVPLSHPGYRAHGLRTNRRRTKSESALARILTRILSYHVRPLRIQLTTLSRMRLTPRRLRLPVTAAKVARKSAQPLTLPRRSHVRVLVIIIPTAGG